MSLINKQWSSISTELVQDPQNFELWQSLIEAAEWNEKRGINKSTSEEELNVLRTSYNSFLEKFPFQFKYWIRYAEWEFKLGNTSTAEQIYLRGLNTQLSHCIELWISYLNFKINTINDNISEILQKFEAARDLIGFHFFGFEFYELYLSFLDNYKNDNNEFEKKYYILLRIILEIPIYHYGIFYKKWFDLIDNLSKVEKLAKQIAPYIAPANEIATLASKKNTSIFNELKKRFTDAYIATQYHSFELYELEKKLIPKSNKNPQQDNDLRSRQELDAWMSYIDYLEIKQYPIKFIELVYYRFLYNARNYPQTWSKFADYYIYHAKFNKARKILTDGVKYVDDYKLLIKLVDLEIFLKNYQRAINLLISYIQYNSNVPIPIRDKVHQVKQLIDQK